MPKIMILCCCLLVTACSLPKNPASEELNLPLQVADFVSLDMPAQPADQILDAEKASDASHTTLSENQQENNPNNADLFPVNREPDDVWQRLRNTFSLPAQKNPRLDQQLKWYARHPEYMKRVSKRAAPYLHYIVETAEAMHIPSEIALLPIVESAFKPFAYSHGRASGIWQFIPATGKRFGLKQNWWYDGRRDVYASTIAAYKLLTRLQKQFKGDWLLALAAYNSGERKIHRAIRKNKRQGKPTDFWHLKLPAETRAYVPKLLALKRIIADPEKYNIQLTKIENTPYFEKVDIQSQIDLARVADLSTLPLDEVYKLNPAFNRWATSPTGPHYILLPIKQATIFKQKLVSLPPEQRIRWIRHKIRKGETISNIADKYNTSIASIKRVNRMRKNLLRTGRSLTIPVASRSLRSYKYSAKQRLKSQQNIPRKGIKMSHIIRQGDTFWSLSRQHKVSIRALAKWNGMAPRDTLKPGQKLIIWSRTGRTAAYNDHAPGKVYIPKPRNILQRIAYRVRHGDSLGKIANKFKVSIRQLLRWNKRLRNKKYIQPGQRVTLYVDVTRQTG
ncbi:LysM peptidoglycan-binding domain-containing protein [Beggiatoa alba]|nr:LysM peptidoglycan-binding domain-containing protein [Beggiatoa alba]